MFLFFLILIKPLKGEFRTKIDNLRNEIKAYSLLERKIDNADTKTLISGTKKVEFIAPPENRYSLDKKIKINSLLSAIRKNKPIFWNNSVLEIIKN